MKISDMKTAEEVLAEDLRDPEFHQEWVRTARARAVAVQIVAYRAEHGMTQSGLARRLGMKQSAIARLETAEHNPTFETLERLSHGLGVGFHIDIAPESPTTVQLVAG
jgi:ribosome-binding protein aMBF1 (putative translation factor)